MIAQPTLVKPVKLTLPWLHPKQREFVDDQHRVVVAACGSKLGKLICLEEKIQTPHGLRRFGDIAVGDFVYGDDGRPTRVVYVSPTQYSRQAYRISFSDGSVVIAGSEHLWAVQRFRASARKDRERGTKPTEILSTQDILDRGLYKRKHAKYRGYVWRIQNAQALQFPTCRLPLDPYLLGTWLGDGDSRDSGITSADKEIVEAWSRAGWLTELTGPYHYRLCRSVNGQNKLRRILSKLDVLGKDKKRIPSAYMHAAVPDRLALLQGLMDSDGFCSLKKRSSGASAIFYNTNGVLAGDVRQLAQSLGLRVSYHTKRAKLYGVDHGICHVLIIKGPMQLFRLPRKAERYTPKPVHRSITAIDPVDPVPMQCIQVDNESHLYTIGEACIPTHNTVGLSIWLIREAWNKDQRLCWWTAPTYKQAAIAFKLMGRLLPPKRFKKRASAGEMVYELLYIDGRVRSIIDFRSADRPESLRGEGVHACVIDEAGYWKRESFVSVMTTLTATRGKLRIISTPKGRNWFYDEWAKGWYPEQRLKNPEYWSYQLPTWANPLITKEAIELLRKNLTQKEFKQEICAEFLEDGSGVFTHIKDCQGLCLLDRPVPGRRYVLGIDWAKHEDYTVFIVMDAILGKVVYVERFTLIDWNTQISRALKVAKVWNQASILMDSTGAGDVPFDAIAAVYANVEGYNIYNNEPKVRLVRTLQLAMERKEITLPALSGYATGEDENGKRAELAAVIEQELMQYSANITTTGKVQYGAPEGYHDDCVIALALAVMKLNETPFEYRHSQERRI